jgi:hypothetical protein
MPATECPSPTDLTDFAVGRLSAERLESLARHLDGCPACSAALEELDSSADPLVSGLRGTEIVGEPLPEPVPTELLDAARRALFQPPADSGKFLVARKLGKFELMETLGGGSFGYVLKARDTELERTVALKIARSGSLATAEDVDRFLREARSAARLKHPAIVSLYETGKTADGTCYLVEEFIDGATLADFAKQRKPDFRRSVELVAGVADALAYAHREGIIHRDVKPTNILIDPQGRPHLTDFGLAKRYSDDAEVTRAGEVLGTPAYMSPEQARGDSRTVDARTDVYGLGVVLYELLTGERPFRGNRRMLLEQVLHDEPRAPRRLNDRVPRDLETICQKAMAKLPGRRYATAAEMADDLRRWMTGEPIHARPIGRLERAVRWCLRNPLPVGLLAAVTAGSALGFLHLAQLSQELVRSSAVESAAQHHKLLEAINSLYSADVVERLAPHKVPVTDDYDRRPGAVPLPATLTIRLGRQLENEAGVQVRLFSDFPLGKDNGPKDDFEREAIRRLKADPDVPFYRFEVYKQKPSLRYAVARREQESCTKCHNHHPDSPKRDWKAGDVRGVLEIIRPLDHDEHRTADGLRGTFILTAVTFASLMGATLLILVIRNRLRLRAQQAAV